MRAAAAHALVSELRVLPRNEAAEREALGRLAAWAGQFTPAVSIVGSPVVVSEVPPAARARIPCGPTTLPHRPRLAHPCASPPPALVLEIEGSLALFGGLGSLLQRVRHGVRQLGYAVTLAVAPTPLAATWLARQGGEAQVTDLTRLPGVLFRLPLRVLGLSEKQRTLLRGIGVRYLGECLRLSRHGLAQRLGPEFVLALDRALGRLPDPRPAYTPPPVFTGRLLLSSPAEHTESLLFPIHRLLLELTGFLTARAAGVQTLTLELHHEASTTRVRLDLVTPTRDIRHLTVLVREHLERVTLPRPVEEVVLASNVLRALAAHNQDFFGEPRPAIELRAAIVERLRARLGRKAVQGLSQVAEHRPERAWRYVEPGTAETTVRSGRRPLWLLPEPVPLELHGDRPYLDGVLLLERDRERIESGWWDGHDVRRDYFVARNQAGACLWVFRELDGARRWFLHGVFG